MIEYDGKEWWPGLLGRETEAMDEDTCKMFIQCTTMDMAGVPEETATEMHEHASQNLGYKILNKRLEAAGCNVSLPTKLFVASICDRPGTIVMWAYTLNLISKMEALDGPVTVSKIADHFPMGLPTMKAYKEAWDEQKASGEPLGNKIDNWEYWPGVGKETEDGCMGK